MWSSTEMSQSRFRSDVMIPSLNEVSARKLADEQVLYFLESPDSFDPSLAAETALLVSGRLARPRFPGRRNDGAGLDRPADLVERCDR